MFSGSLRAREQAMSGYEMIFDRVQRDRVAVDSRVALGRHVLMAAAE